jgi:D-sedoheptulose 7-phosphate isomerase
MQSRILSYFDHLLRATVGTQVTDRDGRSHDLGAAFTAIGQLSRRAHAQGRKVMFIGNGGSAGIASHMAVDFTKNGGMRALAFNDGAMLTCFGNDLGYDNVFAKAIEMHAAAGDVLIAISSSGRSQNILNGVGAARGHGCKVVTFSGFRGDNPLRRMGDWNLWVNSGEYGFVEVAHQALIHAVLDLAMGWGETSAAAAE